MKAWEKVQSAASVHLAYYERFGKKLDHKLAECGVRSDSLQTGEVCGWGDEKGREVNCHGCLRQAIRRYPRSFLGKNSKLLLDKLEKP